MKTSIQRNGTSVDFDFSDLLTPDGGGSAKFSVRFHKTLRIPDDSKSYGLPPSLGQFKMEEVEDYKDRLPEDVVKKGGVFFPMWLAEAMWVSFERSYFPGRGNVPFAVRVSTGKKSALTGEDWSQGLKEKDYMVCPPQPWLDGFVVEKDVIRQFIATPKGSGLSVESQLNGGAVEKEGGLQIEVIPMKKEYFEKHFPLQRFDGFDISRSRSFSSGFYCCDESVDSGAGPVAVSASYAAPAAASPLLSYTSASVNDGFLGGQQVNKTSAKVLRRASASEAPVQVNSMTLAAGGKMTQEVFADPYGADAWDMDNALRIWVHLFDVDSYVEVTGKQPPPSSANQELYRRQGYKWNPSYNQTLQATNKLAAIKSVATLQKENGEGILPPSEVQQQTEQAIPLVKEGISQGEW